MREQIVQPENVGIEKTAEIFRTRVDVMRPKAFSNQGRIGSPCEIQTSRRVRDVECGRKGACKGFHTRAAGADQGAVDIEEDQSDHGPK